MSTEDGGGGGRGSPGLGREMLPGAVADLLEPFDDTNDGVENAEKRSAKSPVPETVTLNFHGQQKSRRH